MKKDSQLTSGLSLRLGRWSSRRGAHKEEAARPKGAFVVVEPNAGGDGRRAAGGAERVERTSTKVAPAAVEAAGEGGPVQKTPTQKRTAARRSEARRGESESESGKEGAGRPVDGGWGRRAERQGGKRREGMGWDGWDGRQREGTRWWTWAWARATTGETRVWWSSGWSGLVGGSCAQEEAVGRSCHLSTAPGRLDIRARHSALAPLHGRGRGRRGMAAAGDDGTGRGEERRAEQSRAGDDGQGRVLAR